MTDGSRFVEISVRGFFTSDSTGMNVAPSIIFLSASPEKVADAVQSVANKFATDAGAASRILEAIAGDGFSQAAGAKDWRFMTREEIDEYREDE